MTPSASLQQRHPGLFWVPGLIALNLVLFGIGLFTPVITLRQVYVFNDTFSIFSGICVLYQDHERFLAAFIFLFSILFPAAKLGLLTIVWFRTLKSQTRERALKGLAFLGKWSMMDVFVIALTVIAAKLSGFADAQARYGLYLFGGAVIMSMLMTRYLTKLAKPSVVPAFS